MNAIACTLALGAFASSAALAQESRPSLFENPADSLPRSLSQEPPRREAAPAEFSLGPAVGYLNSRGADRGTWFAGAQARLGLLPFLAAEASITFHNNEYEDGDVDVTQYPVQVTALLYPFGQGSVRPYALAGVGWYYTRTTYSGVLDGIFKDQTSHEFGAHAGAGLDLRLGPNLYLNADLRYIFLHPDVDGVASGDFNYWQITGGLNFVF